MHPDLTSSRSSFDRNKDDRHELTHQTETLGSADGYHHDTFKRRTSCTQQRCEVAVHTTSLGLL